MRAFALTRALMDKLRYSRKFALIFCVVFFPMLVLGFIIVRGINKDIYLLEKRMDGIAIVSAIRQPLEVMQQHRGMSSAFLAGNAEFKDRIPEKRTVVNERLTKMLDLAAGYPHLVSTDELSQIRDKWSYIETEGLQLERAENFAHHNELVGMHLDLLVNVANRSGMKSDDVQVGSAMAMIASSSLPRLIENMGKARALGSVITGQRKYTAEQHEKLMILNNNILLYFKDLSVYVSFILRDEGVKNRLGTYAQENAEAIASIEEILDSKILKGDFEGLTSSLVFDTATKAIASSFKLFDEMTPFMTEQQDSRQADRQFTRAVAVGLIVAVLIAISMMFVGFYQSVIESLEAVNEASSRMAEGDLTVELHLSSKDELSEIAKNYNDMVRRIARSIQEVVNSGDSLAQSSDSVLQVALKNSESVELQQKETDLVNVAIKQMTDSIQEVSGNAVLAASAARTADDNAQNGKTISGNAVKAIEELAHKVDQSAERIKSLEADCESINSVLDAIKSVAKQTNLLALNAAIESSSAGEYGKGFAILADEIRSLSIETGESVGEIEEVIEKLQRGSENAVKQMGFCREQAKEGVELVLQVAGSLDEIQESVTTINEMNGSIASASEEQVAVSNEISKNAGIITDMSNNSANAAAKTADSARDLSQLSANLKEIVQRFILKRTE